MTPRTTSTTPFPMTSQPSFWVDRSTFHLVKCFRFRLKLIDQFNQFSINTGTVERNDLMLFVPAEAHRDELSYEDLVKLRVVSDQYYYLQ